MQREEKLMRLRPSDSTALLWTVDDVLGWMEVSCMQFGQLSQPP